MIATHLSSRPLVPEVLRRLALGTVVRLPDETLAEVVHSTVGQVEVLHGYLRAAALPGAGPWTFQRWQVEEATESEQVSYWAACASPVVMVVEVRS